MTLVSNKIVRFSAQFCPALSAAELLAAEALPRKVEKNSKQIILPHNKHRNAHIPQNNNTNKRHDPAKRRGQQRERECQQSGDNQAYDQAQEEKKTATAVKCGPAAIETRGSDEWK